MCVCARERLKTISEALTTVMDFGRMDNHTKPVNILLTANEMANRSALDCELQRTQT